MSLLEYVETRHLTEVDRSWAALAAAVLKSYIEEGCNPDMDLCWFESLCCLANINPTDLLSKIEFIYGASCKEK
jgi:hypothetical protein